MKLYLEIIALCALRRAQMHCFNVTGRPTYARDAEVSRINIIKCWHALEVPADAQSVCESENDLLAEIERYCIVHLANSL